MGDDNVIKVIGIISIIDEPLVTSIMKKNYIKDVFHVPKLQVNLLLVSKVLSNMLKTQFTQFQCIVKGMSGKMIVMGQCKGNLYEMNFTNVQEMDAINSK